MNQINKNLYSSKILNGSEYLNFKYCQEILSVHEEILIDFKNIKIQDDNDLNDEINIYIKKYEVNKEKFKNALELFMQECVNPTGYHVSNIEKIEIKNSAPHTVQVFLNDISVNEKYNFKVSKDQFGYDVPFNFYCKFEKKIIDLFESVCLELTQDENKLIFNMIELGSNYAYYSLLFHKILLQNSKIPVNILVEADANVLERGFNHFNYNNCVGKFYNNILADMEIIESNKFLKDLMDNGVKIVTLSDIFSFEQIDYLDILHCDIDYSEYNMLQNSKEIFQNKSIKYIFLATHGAELHNKCKEFLLDCGYNIHFEHDDMDNPIGWDTLLVMKS
jgi:hypothetical protein